MSKTQPARGMRDFLPADVRKRNYVIGIIKEVYEKYGFEPLETPSVENLETLTGKYGEEGNGLMFKILKRGEKLEQELEAGNIKSENELSDLALRYDLTVPLARVVANYRNELPKFFKRYQIQPVWRADRPAKGRYREFYQCDVDAIGSSSMLVEAELISAVSEILERLGFEVFVVSINHREILRAMLDKSGIPENFHIDTLTALDKRDKIGDEGVLNEFKQRNIPLEGCLKFMNFLIDTLKLSSQSLKDESKTFDIAATSFKTAQSVNEISNIKQLVKNSVKSNTIILERILGYISGDKEGERAINDLKRILKLTENNLTKGSLLLNVNLARGLSYYTGAIFEVVLTNGDFQGSIAGGGRYDGLIGMFGKEQIPAVGFSIGLERILFVMEERGMFPEDLTANPADVMITLWNEDAAGESLKLAGELRESGLRVLVYPEADKLGKQFKYADSLGISFVCVLGDEELAENNVSIKNLKTGEQETVSRDEIAGKIKN